MLKRSNRQLKPKRPTILTGYSLRHTSRPLLIIALARQRVILTATAPRFDSQCSGTPHDFTNTCAECAGPRGIHCSTAFRRPSSAHTHLNPSHLKHRSQPRSRRSQRYFFQTTQWAAAGTPSAARTPPLHGAPTTVRATLPQPTRPLRATTARHLGINARPAIVICNTCTRNCNTSSAKYGATHKDTLTKSSSWSSCLSSRVAFYTSSPVNSA